MHGSNPFFINGSHVTFVTRYSDQVKTVNPTQSKHEMESQSELHDGNCVVLAILANDLRHTILGDMENLRFEVGATDLISEETQNSKDAGTIVSEIQNRLLTDKLVWSNLITLLRRCRRRHCVASLRPV